ncbi:flippase [Bacillus sp. WLY-B-L8]|uniref:flippase n=1 Tax=Bacillus multifaciens TaxID=3068506 RepID=UPI002742266E|nr:flippase [Bacillus sp. WLY-B-L8]MDP7978343.1 flippase [Bacillus sp. WLY-B-L8]
MSKSNSKILSALSLRFDIKSKIFTNTVWLLFDKIFRFFTNFIISIWIARFLGPDNFGILSYAQAFTTLFMYFATLGLDNIVIRNIVNKSMDTNTVLGSAFVLKIAGGIITFFTINVVYFLMAKELSTTFWLIVIISFGMIFQCFDTIGFWYQAQVKSKKFIIAKDIALAISTILKILLIISKGSLITFAFFSVLEVLIGGFLLVLIYRRDGESLRKWKYESETAKRLLKDSWPLIFSGMAIMIYMRIDQIMIQKFLGSAAVGVYTAATKLSESWYFIPTAIAASTFPSIIEAKKVSESLYYEKLKKLLLILVAMAYAVSIVITFSADYIINLFYGIEYQESAMVLTIHIWASAFVFVQIATGSWFINENLQLMAFYRNFIGAIGNILLNLYTIPKYGIVGAAIGTIVSYALVVVFPMLYSPSYRKISRLIFSAFILKRR